MSTEASVLLSEADIKIAKNAGWTGKTYKYRNKKITAWTPLLGGLFNLQKTDNGMVENASQLSGKMSKEAFVKACRSFASPGSSTSIEDLRRHVRVFGAQYDMYAQKLVDSRDEKARRKTELTKLFEMEKVVDVKIAGDELQVYTNTLICTFPDRDKKMLKRVLGNFKITIDLTKGNNDEESDIRAYNLKRRVWGHGGSCSAPHAFSDGQFCYGNVSDMIRRLLGDRKYSVVVAATISFLETGNVNDAGYYAYKWPKIGETEEQYKKRLGKCYCKEVNTGDLPMNDNLSDDDSDEPDIDCNGDCERCGDTACQCIEDCPKCKTKDCDDRGEYCHDDECPKCKAKGCMNRGDQCYASCSDCKVKDCVHRN